MEKFTPVTHRKPKHRKGKSARPRERTIEERVESKRQAMKQSGYTVKCIELLREVLSRSGDDAISSPPKCVVCLGLGSIAESSKSQEQFVLLEGILATFSSQLDPLFKTQCYDPAFTPEDQSYLESKSNEILDRPHSLRFESPTLLFLPHCPRFLLENIIERNWDPLRLGRLLILGNRLEAYDDPAHPSSSSSLKSPFLLKSLPLWRSEPLPETKDHLEAFSDLAIQWTPQSKLSQQGKEFWMLETKAVGAGDLIHGLESVKIE